jgi:hypothetical protein
MQLSNCLFPIVSAWSRVCAVSKWVGYFKICILVTILTTKFGHLEPYNVKLRQ